MAEYLILLYDDEAAWADAGEPEASRIMEEHNKFASNNAASMRGGNALQSTTTATSVRRDNTGGVRVTDGAFIETKEALGGYYLIEAPDLDEAIAIAHQVPTLSGGVEVRPIRVFS